MRQINTPDSHGKWAVVTESQGTTATMCITCCDSRSDAVRQMNEIADAGESAEVMLTAKALRLYPDCVVQ